MIMLVVLADQHPAAIVHSSVNQETKGKRGILQTSAVL